MSTSKTKRDGNEKRSCSAGSKSGGERSREVSEESIANSRSRSSSSSGPAPPLKHVLRWLTPSPAVLDRIVSHRQRLNNAVSAVPEINVNGNTSLVSTNFIGILKNSVLPPAKLMSVILKEIYTIKKSIFENPNPTAAFPKKLLGLQIPPKTLEHFHSEDSVKITVYFLSEALARELNVRVSKKKRQKKKKKESQTSIKVPASQGSSGSGLSTGTTGDSPVDLNVAILKTPSVSVSMSVQSQIPQIDRKRKMQEMEELNKNQLGGNPVKKPKLVYQLSWTPPVNWMPFDPKLMLSTVAIKYNKSSWSKWPLDHVCVRLSKAPEVEGQNLLMQSILNTRVCSKPECPLTSSDLIAAINFNSSSVASTFSDIVLKMVKFHRNFKQIHLLLKQCLSFWILKENKKLVKREERREYRKNKAIHKRRKIQLIKEKKNANIPLIELSGGSGSKSESSSSDYNSKLSLSKVSAMEVALRTKQRSQNKNQLSQNSKYSNLNNVEEMEIENIEVVDLTVSSPSTSTTRSLNSQELRKNNNNSNHSSQNPNKAQHYFSKSFSFGSSFSATKNSGNISKASFNFSTSIYTPEESRRQRKLFVFNKLKETVSHSCLLSTLSQLFHMSGANQLLGSSANQKKFWRFVKQSVFLGGIRSELNLQQLMLHLNPESCEWLNSIEDKQMKIYIFAKVVRWLFQEYVLVMLRSSFYVTELSDSRYQLAFYLRETWKSVTEKMRWNYLSSSKFRSLTVPVRAGQKCQGQVTSSKVELTGKLRFIPKKNNSVRPILSHHPMYKKKLDFRLSKFLAECISSSIVPYGVPDATVVHLRWKRFIGSWKEKGCPTLYFLRTDIRDAYPSVNVNKLTEIIDEFLAKPGKLVMLNYKLSRAQGGRCNKLYSFVRHTDHKKDPFFIKCRRWNPYIRDKVLPFNTVKAAECLKSTLNSSAAVVQVGRNKYTFENGLPQGWTLSQFLCNIYYGTMDNENFSNFIDSPDEFFVRKVDDYFFVSMCPERVSDLYKLMKNGFPDFNCRLNVDKSFNNLYVRSNVNAGNLDMYSCIPFCGWKFCLTSGHLMRDFSSYAGMDSCSTLTFKMGSSSNISQDPAFFVTERLKNLTPLRMYAMLFDPTLNCRQRIFRNLLDAGLISAFRFYAMCRVVFPNFSVFSDTKVSRSVFGGICVFAARVVKCIRGLERQWNRGTGSISSLYNCGASSEINCGVVPGTSAKFSKYNLSKKIGKRNHIRLPRSNDLEVNPVHSVGTCTKKLTSISDQELLVIVFHAFIIKLSQHDAVFKNNLLPWLRRKRKTYCDQVNSVNLGEIRMVVGDEMPLDFARFKI